MKVSLKAARVNAELTQIEAAERAGLSREGLIYIEKNGGADIKYSTLLTLCSVYNCTPDDIFLPFNSTLSEAPTC